MHFRASRSHTAGHWYSSQQFNYFTMKYWLRPTLVLRDTVQYSTNYSYGNQLYMPLFLPHFSLVPLLALSCRLTCWVILFSFQQPHCFPVPAQVASYSFSHFRLFSAPLYCFCHWHQVAGYSIEYSWHTAETSCWFFYLNSSSFSKYTLNQKSPLVLSTATGLLINNLTTMTHLSNFLL